MSEKVDEEQIGQEESNLFFGPCVFRTLKSILSDIAGKDIEISRAGKEIRLHQMEEAVKWTNERLARIKAKAKTTPPTRFPNPEIIEARQEYIGKLTTDLVSFINALQELENDPAGQVLKSCEIKQVRGGFRNAKKYLKQGYGAAIVVFVPEDRTYYFAEQMRLHIFHLGYNQKGKLTDKSDPGFLDTIDWLDQRGLNNSMKMVTQNTNAWNILLIKRKE